MKLIDKIITSIKKNASNNAFFINGKFYTYEEFSKYILKIQYAIQNQILNSEINVGLMANNDIQTYACIIALWLEGKAFVPMYQETPKNRNLNVLHQSGIKTIICSNDLRAYDDFNCINSSILNASNTNLISKIDSEETLAYVLFTSGTTGVPKGVPITHRNINHFAMAMKQLDYNLNPEDKCLQMFDLTFDFSVMAYLFPILHGACTYTVTKNKIKYFEIYKLLNEHKLTVLPLVPSFLHYLRPFFHEINAPWVKYSVFCGEALPLDITNEWSHCTSNSTIINFYGPTEATVFCTYYKFEENINNKEFNGILSIGKPMKGIDIILVNENNEILNNEEKGELCIAGEQLTNGYWNNNNLNEVAFFDAIHNNKPTRFYKTGDLCFMDNEKDLMYLSRIDFQAKIQGFRVELSEIEFYSKEIIKKTNIAAVAIKNNIGNTEIGLAIESNEFNYDDLIKYLKLNLPEYMIPTKIRFFKPFPLNNNGKTDRNKITELFEK
jgi:D-alanine--poly(phosphoribitol) ligase subunit 1